MASLITFGHLVASGRRLNPAPFTDFNSPSTYMSFKPIYGSYYLHNTQEAKNEDDYLDLLTRVTDADEVYAEQCEDSAAGEVSMRSQKHFDSFFDVPAGIDGPCSRSNAQAESTTTLASIQEDEQLVCSSFLEASEYKELIFDADTPFASDEDLALRSIFASGSMPEPVTRSFTRSHDELSSASKLRDTSHLIIQPTLAVNEFHDHVSDILDFDASPVIEQAQNMISGSTLRQQGSSLVYSQSPLVALETATKEPWKLEHDPVLRHAAGRTVLPGLDHFRNVTVCSATIQYDRDLEDLFYATSYFLDDCHDGECTCLDGKMHRLRVPGENFMLAGTDDDVGLSVRCPKAKDICDLIDELVHADMFDVNAVYSDNSEEAQLGSDLYFDTTLQNPKTSVTLDQITYPSALDTVSLVGDSEKVLDVSDTDSESFSLTQHPELSYVDTDTHQCIAYTAFNQLVSMEEDETRPVIHRDTPDEDYEPEICLAELVYLYPKMEGYGTLLPRRNGSNLNRSKLDINSSTSRPPALLQPKVSLQSTVRQRCEPYGLYSSNRSQRQRLLPQLRLATQLLPKPRPLSMVKEEELSCSNSSSRGESLDFADHRGFFTPLENRRERFLNDEDESEDDLKLPVMPTSPLHCICEDFFTDAVWGSTPDLTLAHPSPNLRAEIASASGLTSPLLEAFEVEIHSRLAFMFNYMNSGCLYKLPALSRDLHWAMCALANVYPTLTLFSTLLDSLGAAVEIMVERMVASTIAS